MQTPFRPRNRIALLLVMIAAYSPAWGYYPELPKDMDKITEGDKYEMCLTLYTSSADINQRRFFANIEKYYGDKNEFFNTYILSLSCYPGYISFSDGFFKGSRSRLMSKISNYTMRLGKFDRNAYIRIHREGQIYEGPLRYVFLTLNEKYPDNVEYRNVLSITNIPAFFKGEMKTCAQMQSADPLFPCELP